VSTSAADMGQVEQWVKIPVGISSCLLGEEVRYDGGHKNSPYLTGALGRYLDFVPFCPEVDIGLGVPREPIQLVTDGDITRCVGTTTTSLDVTDRLSLCADKHRGWQSNIFGYILKSHSPSCGMDKVKLLHEGQLDHSGVGIYAHRMMQNFPLMPVEEEEGLADPELRHNFVQRVFIYQCWNQLCLSGLSWSGLNDFHSRHQLIFMSHDQEMTHNLGYELSEFATMDIAECVASYGASMMSILKIGSTRDNHVNVLQYIQGHLNTSLEQGAQIELSESIEQYRRGVLPLEVPVTLLRHHFMRRQDDCIWHSYYIHPYPNGILLNLL